MLPSKSKPSNNFQYRESFIEIVLIFFDKYKLKHKDTTKFELHTKKAQDETILSDNLTYHFQYIYDFCVVWTPKV